PLSLGGSNDIANLWPKSAKPFPGFYEKNITGNYLHQEVCADRISLSVAQKRIANDWVLIFNTITCLCDFFLGGCLCLCAAEMKYVLQRLFISSITCSWSWWLSLGCWVCQWGPYRSGLRTLIRT
ncbi:MAG: hypothetical protein AAB865_00895, partial [Patescibacteria group bacterium]